jgi:branched-chain amino acid transport system permease protein
VTMRTLVEGGSQLRTIRIGAILVTVVVLFFAPLVNGQASQISTWSEMAAYAVAILGLGLVTGYCGQISIGHSAFVGIGGYTTVILVADHGWPYLATIPIAVLICLVAGALVGIPALRIRGLYLAIVTLAVAAVFPTMIDRFEGLTGGPNGKTAPEMTAPDWFPVDQSTRSGPAIFEYYVIVLVAILMFALAFQLVRSRVGRAFVAIRESPYSASAAGIDVSRYKVYAFAVSAAFAGVAGSLLTIQTPQVTGQRFDINLAIFLLIGLIAGGSTTIWGAIPGALIFVGLSSYIPDWVGSAGVLSSHPNSGQVVGIVSGALLIAFAFLLPGGVMEGVSRLTRRFVRVVRQPPEGWQAHLFEPLVAHPESPPPTVSEPVVNVSGSPDSTERGSE